MLDGSNNYMTFAAYMEVHIRRFWNLASFFSMPTTLQEALKFFLSSLLQCPLSPKGWRHRDALFRAEH